MKKIVDIPSGCGCFSGVELLQCFHDFLSCESFGELCVHIFYDTPRDCTNDFIDPGGRGGSIYFLKIGYCSGCDTFLAFTPYTIIIPKPQNGILFPFFRSTGMENFSVSVTFPIPMNLAALLPNGLLTIQKVIYFLSKLINLCPSITLLIFNGNGIKSSSFLCNFLWYIAYYILIPTCQCTCTSLEIRSNPFKSGKESAQVPCSLNHFITILPFDPHGLKMETAFTFTSWRR